MVLLKKSQVVIYPDKVKSRDCEGLFDLLGFRGANKHLNNLLRKKEVF
jgi:hypothetical protein